MGHKEVLGRIEDILKDGECGMYLILKTTSPETNKARKALSIGLKGDAHLFFRGIFQKKVSELKAITDFPDFLSCIDPPDYNVCCPFVNNTDEKEVFKGLLLNMKNATMGARAYLDKRNSKHVYGFAIEVKKADVGRTIYFRKLTATKMMMPSHSTFIFYDGCIDVVKGHVLGFDENLDGIYYELKEGQNQNAGGHPPPGVPSSVDQTSQAVTPSPEKRENTLDKVGNKGIYVLNIPYIEDLLALEDLYKEKSDMAYDVITDTGMVDINKTLYNACLEARSTTKKIAKLVERNELTETRFAEIKQACVNRSNVFAFRIEGEKIILDSQDAVDQFLSLCNKNILRDILTDDLYWAKDVKAFIPKRTEKATVAKGTIKEKS